MSTIVTGSIPTLQLFALLAVITFGAAAVAAAMVRNAWGTLQSVGLALASLALMFHP